MSDGRPRHLVFDRILRIGETTWLGSYGQFFREEHGELEPVRWHPGREICDTQLASIGDVTLVFGRYLGNIEDAALLIGAPRL